VKSSGDGNHPSIAVFVNNTSNLVVDRVNISNVEIGAEFVNAGASVIGTTITDAYLGIAITSSSNVKVSGSSISGVFDGISLIGFNSSPSPVVTIDNTTISDFDRSALILTLDKAGTTHIANSTIIGKAGSVGISVSNLQYFAFDIPVTDVTLTIDNVRFIGPFTNALGIYLASSTSINGSGNTTTDATFSDSLCRALSSIWTGSVTFDGTAVTPATCPN
jgi:hypothetical protein